MPPSERATLRSGNFRSTFDHTRSAAACTMFIGVRVIRQSIGASSEVMTSADDEPMCIQSTTSSSLHAFQTGSQWSEWMLGHPSFDGFSEKVTAWAPLAAVRRISAAITSGPRWPGSGTG